MDHDATVGVEFGAKTINSKSKNVKLQIWDTVQFFIFFKFGLNNPNQRQVRNHLSQSPDHIIEGIFEK